ncbi:MAG: hypothetical protein Q7T32_11560, partial [Moraxellaceae bacterium]|nr:hypothetical protein [Moraxellaceae bacterium]
LGLCMSKIKNPQEKKRQSYSNDCRNTYGENNKGSRKSIRKNKQLNSQVERSAVKKLNNLQRYPLDDDFSTEIESQVVSDAKKSRLRGFKKYPDQPLVNHIKTQLRKRNERFGRRADI